MLSEKSNNVKLKKPAKIQHLVNWFYGNYCTRKCYNNIERQREHWNKLQKLAQELESIKMTHKAFLQMIRSDKTICTLSDDEWKNVKFSWRSTNCKICKKFGIK